jgi:phage shock protein PspC (stress-responsive transcriptional regulator)
MIKTVTVNVAGQVFHIDEDAFDSLSAYLKALKSLYGKEEGGDEILSDIEARIAEIFIERLKNAGKKVVSLHDVEHVISLLGRPEEFEEGSTKDESSDTGKTFDAHQKAEKRLFRNPDDQVIAGVCSGLSNYFGISDPVWIRLLFIFLVITGIGSGVILYIILWIIIPEAQTSTQKLQMKGEPVNLENLEKTFKKGIDNIETNIQNMSEDSAFNKILKGLGKVVAAIAKVIFLLVKALVFFVLAVVLFSLVASLFAVSVSGVAAGPFLMDYIFEDPVWGYMAISGLVLVAIITSIYFLLLPFQIFSTNIKPFRKEVSWALGLLWLAGLILLMTGSSDLIRQFKYREHISQETTINDSKVLDTLIIRSNPYISSSDTKIDIGWKSYEIEGDGAFIGSVRLNITPSSDSSFHILEDYSAKGRDKVSATRNVRNIAYNYNLKDNQLMLDEAIGAKVGNNKWRSQKVDLTLQIPEGTILIFHDVEDMVDNRPAIRNASNYIPLESTAWKMEDGFLVALDTNILVDNTEMDKLMSDITPSQSFKNVEISGYIDAEIIGGKELKVLSNGADKFSIKVRNDKLILESNPSIISGNRKAPKVKIFMPILDEVELTGLCEAELTGFNRGDLKVTATGSSTFIMSGITLSEANIELSGVSNFKGFGTINRANIQASGSSSVDAMDIRISDLNIDLSGACDADVQVEDEIVGDLSGASTLTYKGKPRIEVNSSGAAKVKPVQ